MSPSLPGLRAQRCRVRSLYALAASLALVLFPGSALAEDAAPRPNVIFIVADDMNTDLGCFGHPLVKTPNLERLVKRGVRFDRAYCQSPICNPSRTSFLSGQRPGSRLKEVVFLPDLFRAQGYLTIEVGKVTHSYGITASAIRWDIEKKAGIGNALAALSAKRPQPFFLAVGMAQTHPGYSFERKFLDDYPPDKLKLLHHPAELLAGLPKNSFNGILVKPKETEAARREHIARYYAAIATIDEQVGQILDLLDREQLWDSTIVVFLSDHGRHLGEFGGVYDKRTMFEASLRVPLIIAAPGGKTGRGCPRVVELLDLYPTLADLCRLPAPRGLEGKSMVPLLRDPDQAWPGAAFASVQVRGTAARSVRSERYRYIDWPGQKEAVLFDYETDPTEQRNLIGSPEHAKVADEFRRLLEK